MRRLWLFVVVRFLIIWSCVVPKGSIRAEEFRIYRQTSPVFDSFKLPPSLCGGGCGWYGGTWHDSTQCKCDCNTNTASFAVYNSKWACVKNEDFRTFAGCGYRFYSEPRSSAPKVLELNSEEKIPMVTTGCTIDLAASRYLHCDGTWAPLPLQSSEKPFKLKLDSSANIGGVVYGTYTFEVVSSPDTIKGQIIILSVTCAPPSRSPCLLFKMAGDTSCPTVPATVRPATLPTNTSSPPVTTTTTTPRTTSYSTEMPAFITSDTTLNGHVTTPRAESERNVRTIAGGATGGVALIAMVTMIVCLVWRRRRKPKHVPKPVKLRVSTLNGNTNNRVQEHDQVSEEGTPGIVAYSTSAEEQEIEFQDTGAIANKRKDGLEMDNSQIGADNNNEDGDGEYMEMSSTQQHPKYYNAPVDLNISNDPGRALKQNTGEEKKTSNVHHKHVQPSANYEELRGDNSEYASLYSRQSKKKTPPHPSDSVNKSETRVLARIRPQIHTRN
ncbi:uncharacterized protein LOC116617938 [Nematostella vectensis]|uniref:uncharacterized protein LOC116617938 n=1 Tax=Nematostella vectensis TaxID=45351 RepID=UPI002076EAC7|nr:uncharacterized protein LOC116617938 [Nematostella vectensis]